ncbi:hypothetical protein SOCEGT47_010350 [Sorangium cellulosum]|jgi:hypothetical protein|uniref:Uncharacterized protein n=1 Tax=Sorangium cellulosum TaxID=56 RepID=A0A4P2PVR7_SORCE|nr:hypothetical protein [Sorangium cellulosum]AUX20563.1 hypothetical protein SOCEGT47_010350 [Sorangium cellulosum]
MHGFDIAFASPRKLPRARDLRGNVAVLDIAFASEAGGKSFETVTLPLIRDLGPRLAAWVDHHDSAHHARFAGDPRFVLSTKAEHGACPEMITPELVARAGRVDTLVCHVDFDGLASGAKWMRGGVEPYPGCDEDARAIDTRIGVPGPVATRMDRALRARPRDQALFGLIVRHLASGLADPSLWGPIDQAGAELAALEAETRRIALRYERVEPGIVLVDATQRGGAYDKTLLLLIGQERAPISVVIDGDSVTFAARFDSGVNFLEAFNISGGMPTRLSLQRTRLKDALVALGVKPADASRFASPP